MKSRVISCLLFMIPVTAAIGANRLNFANAKRTGDRTRVNKSQNNINIDNHRDVDLMRMAGVITATTTTITRLLLRLRLRLRPRWPRLLRW